MGPHRRIIKVCITGPLWGEFTHDRWIPAQMARNAEKASIWCRHHDWVGTQSFGEEQVQTVPKLPDSFTNIPWWPLTRASDAGLWCFLWSAPWINGWVSNRDEAGDLRHHSAHYDVIAMPSCGLQKERAVPTNGDNIPLLTHYPSYPEISKKDSYWSWQ